MYIVHSIPYVSVPLRTRAEDRGWPYYAAAMDKLVAVPIQVKKGAYMGGFLYYVILTTERRASYEEGGHVRGFGSS